MTLLTRSFNYLKLHENVAQLLSENENVRIYPTLKANDNFQHLAARITGLEDTIVDRRDFYNESANTHNIALELFPDVFIARTFAFTAFMLLSFDRAETEDVDVRALLQS
ncbi:MAG: LemA family protein [Gammaproteobacteria bacterium]